MSNLEYASGSVEHLDTVASLWMKNARHNATVSTHFPHSKNDVSFEARRSSLKGQAKSGKLRVHLAKLPDWGRCVGYCISTVNETGVGQVESLFVEEAHRCQGIGTELLGRIVDWMDQNGAETKRAYVVVGNERVLNLYRRFGFLPNAIVLEQTGSSGEHA